MALYIRLKNDFWNHRKTAKLRTKIGDDAFWIVPRLWSYAAESQPDGDFSKYSSEEMGMLLGCSKHSSSIRQALLEAGFMDESGCLHDWEEHNGYHAAFADRAKKAADKRWIGHERKEKGKERKGDKHCLSDAPSIQQASEFDVFYAAYPKHKARKDAEKAWNYAKDKPAISVILQAVESQKQSKDWLKDNGQFIPYPASWIRAGRWNDDTGIIKPALPQPLTPAQLEIQRKALAARDEARR